MNITQLPVDIRLGVCLPKECTQEMMDKAQDPISKTLSEWAYFLGGVLGIGFVVRYRVGFVISFVQPDAWYETQSEEKAQSASIYGGFLLLLAILAIGFTILEYFKRQRAPKDNVIRSFRKLNSIDRLLESEETIERTSTKAATLRGIGRAPTAHNHRQLLEVAQSPSNSSNIPRGSPVQTDPTVSLDPKDDTLTYFNSKKFIDEFIECFSIYKNTQDLNNNRAEHDEDKELTFVDGIRVLTM